MDKKQLKTDIHGYRFVDIHVLRTSNVKYPCMDIPIRISLWIPLLEYQCGYSYVDINVDVPI